MISFTELTARPITKRKREVWTYSGSTSQDAMDAAMPNACRFFDASTMLAAVRKNVMLKWQTQKHAEEISDGDSQFGFIGVPEW